MIREKTIFRNILFGAVLLAGGVLAISCSVDETDSMSGMNTITFSTEFTRATATTINNLDEFTVWGWKTDGDGNVTGMLMNGATAANSGNGIYDTKDRTYYWPGCAVDFFAVSPLAATVDDTNGKVYIGEQVSMIEVAEDGTTGTYDGYFAEGTVNADSGRIETLTVHVPEAAAEQADLIYAYTTGKSSGKVPLNFRHALTQVEFKALNTNSWMTVEIDGVKVVSVANHGELALPTETTSATDGAYGTWTPAPVYDKTEYSLDLSSAVSLGSDAAALSSDSGSLFLIPQEGEAWDALTDATNTAAGAYFLISCRITELGVELWPGDGTFAEVAVPFAPDWEQGKKYTYTFNFGEGAGYYPPTDTNAGTPILNGPISFDVEVGDLDGTAGSFDEDDEAETYVVVTTFAELTNAVSNNEHHIIVAADIDINKEENGHGVGIYTDCTIIIEDGCTITAPNHGSSTPYSAFYIEYINDERGYPNLTIDGDGTIATTGDEYASDTRCIYISDGSLTINSGTFLGGCWAVDDYTGVDYCIYAAATKYMDVNVTINGGSFKTGSHSYDLYAYPTSSHSTEFEVLGGRFYMYDPSYYVPSGHSASQDDDGWYVVK